MIIARSGSIAPLLEEWFIHPDDDLSPKTLSRYRGAIRRFLQWFEDAEHRPLAAADLHPITLTGYREALKKTEAVSTINTHLCALRTWCAWLVEHKHLDTNPAKRLKLVGKASSSAPRALTPAQVNALLRQPQSTRNPTRNTAILQMLIQTGMRISECAALYWEDISFGERRGQVLIRSGKGNKVRTIPLNDSARQALADYVAPLLDVEPVLRAVAVAWERTHPGNKPSPLWISERGSALSLREISHMIQQLVRDSAARGLVPSDTTPHSLRHTFATRYLARHPGDLVGLARILGHASITTTQIYVQPTDEQIAERVEGIDLNAYSR